jgi:hypothetical protein
MCVVREDDRDLRAIGQTRFGSFDARSDRISGDAPQF